MPDITAHVGPAVRPEVPPMPRLYTFVEWHPKMGWNTSGEFEDADERDKIMKRWADKGSICFPVTIPGDADRAAQADMVAVPRALVEAVALSFDEDGRSSAAAELRKCLNKEPP